MLNTLDKINQLENELSRPRAQVEPTAIFQAEKDKLQDDYQRSQKRFRTVFEESSVGKRIIDDQLRIIKVNKTLLQILGYSEKNCWEG